MLFLPAGLCLYMVTNSTLTILQQRAIYARLDREEATAASAPMPFMEPTDDHEPDSDPLGEATSASAKRRSIGSRSKKRQRRG